MTRPDLCGAYRRDLRAALDAGDFGFLRGKRVLLTGATGLIGSCVADMLLLAGATVLAAGRSGARVAERFGGACRFVPYDALEPFATDEPADYIIHAAGNARPSMMMAHPADTMLAGIVGVKNLLDAARRNGRCRLLFISSSEVYGRRGDGRAFREDDCGEVDILNPRACYPMGKRAAETLCAGYALEHGVDFVVARPGHIYGPTADERDDRVSSAFAWRAARGEDLTLKSAGSQLRSYCYCVDCASALMTLLGRGERGAAYNISNPDSVVTILQMAQILARAGGVRLLRAEATPGERAAFNPMDNASLCSEKLEALGWRGLFGAEAGLTHTVDALRETLARGNG